MKQQLVGIGYVTRSLDSFYMAPAAVISTRGVVDDTPRQVPDILTAGSVQFQDNRIDTKNSAGSQLVIPLPEAKQKDMTAQKPISITVAEIVPEELLDEPDAPVPETFEVVMTQSTVGQKSRDEVIESLQQETELLQQHLAVKSGELVVKELSAPEGSAAPAEDRSVNQEQVSPVPGLEKSLHDQVFTSAMPRYDVNPPPRYPEVAKLRGWEGKVVFKVLILKSGRVGRLKILVSSGHRSLDRAARKAINRWVFRPATSFGVAIDSQVEIPVTFSLKDL